MRPLSPITLAAFVLMGMMPLSLRAQANYLKNTDLKEGFSFWHGDGESIFLNPDGTEGAEGDKDVIPVIKISLSKNDPRSVHQDFETPNEPKSLNFRVLVYASSDFKRSTFADDYSSSINWIAGQTLCLYPEEVIPNVDFWIRGAPGLIYILSNDLKPNTWATVTGTWPPSPPPGTDRTVTFCVPPGDGAVYIREAAVTTPSTP